MSAINRRKFLQHMTTVSVLSLLPQSILADIISAAVPQGPFGEDSTAEDVTAGLDLSGKTYAITGANSGLGFETMRVLTMRGAHVIGIARTAEKAEIACNSVSGMTTPAFLDLAVPESIVACAQNIRAMNIPLDGLICNAGIMALPELEQINGIEKQFAINHLGHFVLINQLQDTALAAEAGRFVILSSRAHLRAPDGGIEFDNLSGENGEYDGWTAYGQSKLANALCARALAKRLNGTTATANSLHPGVINTNLGRHLPWYMSWGGAMFGWAFMKNVEEGATTQTYLATNPALDGVSGLYFADCNPAEGSEYVTDDDLAEKLWTVSEGLMREYLVVPTQEA